ncbi:hypothetical protein ID866_9974 [Astraeus odoratus]|nr:hypothetical protein ID866_9974 [Astraeus odoratus]
MLSLSRSCRRVSRVLFSASDPHVASPAVPTLNALHVRNYAKARPGATKLKSGPQGFSKGQKKSNGRDFEDSEQAAAAKRKRYTEGSANHRMVLTGAPGCGKSVLLLQALQYCHARDWIVLYFPRTVNLVNSTTTYAYDPRTRTYVQPVFAFETLQRFLTVNGPRLEQLHTKVDVELERRATVPTGTTLAELVRVGIKEQALAPTILTAVLAELGKQTSFPVLLAIDDFQTIYCKTMYRDPHFSRIQPYHLSMPRLLLEYASGQKQFARGAVLGALSGTNTTFRLPLELAEALGLPPTSYSGPYAKRSPELQGYAEGLSRVTVPDALTVSEAAELFDVWRRDRALSAVPNDEMFLAKYSESSGNARDFVWKGLLSTLSL